MSGEQFTEADVQLVARALGADYWTDDERAETARAVLSALAEAGRLVRADADRRDDWGVQVETADQPMIAYAGLTEGQARKMAARSGGKPARRIWTAGPWVEADEDGTT